MAVDLIPLRDAALTVDAALKAGNLGWAFVACFASRCHQKRWQGTKGASNITRRLHQLHSSAASTSVMSFPESRSAPPVRTVLLQLHTLVKSRASGRNNDPRHSPAEPESHRLELVLKPSYRCCELYASKAVHGSMQVREITLQLEIQIEVGTDGCTIAVDIRSFYLQQLNLQAGPLCSHFSYYLLFRCVEPTASGLPDAALLNGELR